MKDILISTEWAPAHQRTKTRKKLKKIGEEDRKNAEEEKKRRDKNVRKSNPDNNGNPKIILRAITTKIMERTEIEDNLKDKKKLMAEKTGESKIPPARKSEEDKASNKIVEKTVRTEKRTEKNQKRSSKTRDNKTLL